MISIWYPHFPTSDSINACFRTSNLRGGAEKCGFKHFEKVAEICKNLPKQNVTKIDAPETEGAKSKSKNPKPKGKGVKKTKSKKT